VPLKSAHSKRFAQQPVGLQISLPVTDGKFIGLTAHAYCARNFLSTPSCFPNARRSLALPNENAWKKHGNIACQRALGGYLLRP